MAKIEIYLSYYCPYCISAKQFLDSKGVAYQEIDVNAKPEEKEIMKQRAKRHTVPQIFINDQHIGGCDDLHALNDAGKLDELLN